jgi:hypothetical protein
LYILELIERTWSWIFIFDSLCYNSLGSRVFRDAIVPSKTPKKKPLSWPPSWLYLLCGRPKVIDMPTGALSIRGVAFQLTRIIKVIFVLGGKLMHLAGLNFL